MTKVLILDHSKSMRNNLRERLEFEGYSTEGAADEAAAAELCGRIPFDLILLHLPPEHRDDRHILSCLANVKYLGIFLTKCKFIFSCCARET